MLINRIRCQQMRQGLVELETSLFFLARNILDVRSRYMAGIDSPRPYASTELQEEDHNWPRYLGMKLRFTLS